MRRASMSELCVGASDNSVWPTWRHRAASYLLSRSKAKFDRSEVSKSNAPFQRQTHSTRAERRWCSPVFGTGSAIVSRDAIQGPRPKGESRWPARRSSTRAGPPAFGSGNPIVQAKAPPPRRLAALPTDVLKLAAPNLILPRQDVRLNVPCHRLHDLKDGRRRPPRMRRRSVLQFGKLAAADVSNVI